MSPLVKTKRQANYDFKRFGAFKGLIEQKKNVVTRSCCQWGFLALVGNWPTRAKKLQFTQELIK
jgi:hypothetical protein